MKTIFVVDDSDTNLTMAETALETHYRVMTMVSAAKMFSLIQKITPDLILLDIEMPEIDGFEALRRLKLNYALAGIPVMFLTGRTDAEVEARGFELGAVDFVTKPFSAPVLQNRIKTYLEIEEIIQQRTKQLHKMQNSIMSVLADMIENRDKGTSGHIERTTVYIRILIHMMMERGVYADELRKWDIERVISSARMHDMGKITITDIIINKPEKLTDDEFRLMKTHAIEGERIIDEIVSLTGEAEFLRNAKLFAGTHHEHWDGSGYPRGLKGAEIPLQGRIMAIVDVYDALVSERQYKHANSHEEAVEIIMKNSGSQFDPEIANTFFEARGLFKAVGMNEQ
ncbi:MAG: response regulator [Treponema sp.]|nr:response regulator [Treponema sp.]